MPETFRALDGTGTWLPPVRSAIVVVVDGLGSAQLRARAGHARFLTGLHGPRDVALSTFPSTTATALTSLLTGADPGEHGMVGYRVRVSSSGLVANQLHGWEDGLLPEDWQPLTPLTRQRADTAPVVVVSKPEFATTGFTRSTTDGAIFVGVADLDERVARAGELARQTPGAFVYLYIPELDGLGHRLGWESEGWITGLERVDAALRELAASSPQTGVLITADHGMLDVPPHRHVLLGEADPLVADVDAIGGEPRMLHLYVHPGATAAVAERWSASEGDRSWVLTRDEALAAGLFGSADPRLAGRIGDVLVAARSGIAYYDDREEDRSAQRMIGQHGSLTAEERVVPLLRAGAFARAR